MNIDKKLIKEIREQHDLYVNDSVLLSVVSQIKQSILKTIMEKKPKLKEFLKKGVSRDFDIGTYKFNQGIREFESVIKEVLK